MRSQVLRELRGRKASQEKGHEEKGKYLPGKWNVLAWLEHLPGTVHENREDHQLRKRDV